MSRQIQEDLTELTKKVSHMGGLVEEALDRSLTALLDRDPALAREVVEHDAAARLYRELIGESIQFMREHTERIGDVMHFVGALRNLERLADHATNIAEDVIFVVQGRIVRHHMIEFSETLGHNAPQGGDTIVPAARKGG